MSFAGVMGVFPSAVEFQIRGSQIRCLGSCRRAWFLRWKQGAMVLADAATNKLAWSLAAVELLLSFPLPVGCGSVDERKWGVAGVRHCSSWPAMGRGGAAM
jgi:hypothetical protein